uniref:Uncharacterized protein n=2 Tax=Gammaproteobacteria TaxID=1236 RepID=E7C6T7_9GAMM|nr:hypothetical protein [uncultured Oceanospirillales bacterium HF0500_29K23]ADI23161.1 hypothetical protein [uncultured gamma proteobacterium HF0770_11A05]
MNLINFHPPSWYANYKPPKNVQLVGDHHIEKGSIVILGGAGGVGKSLAITSLAVAGATGGEWFGLKVHKQFKTMVLQAENQNTRLKNEYENYDISELDDWIKISEPPECGFSFNSPQFLASLKSESEKFGPDLVVLDPWNHIAASDDMQSHIKALGEIASVWPTGEKNPAVLIVAHRRKPSPDRDPDGSDLMHEISGSHKITTIARCVFALVKIPNTSLVKVHCCKNNNGATGDLGFWEYVDGYYLPRCHTATQRGKNEDMLQAIKDILVEPMKQPDLVRGLEVATGKSQSTCYAALKKHEAYLEKIGNEVRLKGSKQ